MDLAILLPVYNEEDILENSVTQIRKYLLSNKISYSKIYIASNASTDKTDSIGISLEKKYADVRLKQIPRKGRGYALRTVMTNTDHDYYLYMDIDLSTDLSAVSRFLEKAPAADLIVGTRVSKGSNRKRSLFREILSISYIILLKILFLSSINDYQCGFKLYSRRMKTLLPEIKDNNWFFDSESIIIAQKKGFTVIEIPIQWTEKKEESMQDRSSKVKIMKTITEYIHNSLELRMRMWKKYN